MKNKKQTGSRGPQPPRSIMKANTLDVERHASSRLADIRYVEDLVLRKRKSNEIPVQQLFRNVSRGARRRTSSHRPRRFPVHLRLNLAAQPSKHTTNRRRRRRRGVYSAPESSTSELLLRLPTHKWHAKRFHFDPSPWEVKTPDRFSERSERSTIKAECQKCTVHDASHVRCLQIAGSVSNDHTKLSALSVPSLFASNRS